LGTNMLELNHIYTLAVLREPRTRRSWSAPERLNRGAGRRGTRRWMLFALCALILLFL
jgi:hypothetical protein